MKLFILFFVISTGVCFGQDDYSITNTLKQTITVKNNTVLEIICYCPNGIKINETPMASVIQNITLEIKATESSIGFHGKQQKPKKVDENFMKFNIKEEDSILKISSNEWSFMHHAFIIDSLTITAPKGMKYNFIKIDGNTLENRKNPFFKE